ncbi:hypothetical protein COOONC_02625 [Cooperia oncophora]
MYNDHILSGSFTLSYLVTTVIKSSARSWSSRLLRNAAPHELLDTPRLAHSETYYSCEKLLPFEHTEVTLALMKLIGIEKEELTTSAVRSLHHLYDYWVMTPIPLTNMLSTRRNLVPELAHKVDSNGFLLLEDFIGYVQRTLAKMSKPGLTERQSKGIRILQQGDFEESIDF